MIHFLAVGDRDYKQGKSEKQHNKNSADSVSIVWSDCALPNNIYMKNQFRQSSKEVLISFNPGRHNVNVQHPVL